MRPKIEDRQMLSAKRGRKGNRRRFLGAEESDRRGHASGPTVLEARSEMRRALAGGFDGRLFELDLHELRSARKRQTHADGRKRSSNGPTSSLPAGSRFS